MVRGRWLVWGGGGLLGVGFLIYFRHLLLPFVVALALAYLLDPLLDRLEAQGHTRVGAIGVVYALFFLLFLLAILFIVPTLVFQVNALIQNFDGYIDSLQQTTSSWAGWADQWIERWPLAPEQKEKIHRYLEELRSLWGKGSMQLEETPDGVALRWVPLEALDSEGSGEWTEERLSNASTGVIAGRVIRPGARDGRFTVVWVEEPYRATTTDEQGRYQLSGLSPGEYTLRARYGDLLQTYPQRVEVRAGFKTTPADLELRAQSGLNLTGVVTWIAERLRAFLLGLINSLSSLLSFILLLPIATYYFLRDYDPLRRRLFVLVPEPSRPLVADLSRRINQVLGGYLRGQFIVCGLVGVETTVLLLLWSLIFGSKYWLILGLLTGLLSVIPYFGLPAAAILTGVISYLTGGWGAAIAALGSILVINFVSDSVVAPKVIGQQVGLHPLVMIFALLAGGSLFGIVGMILAAPVVASIKVVVVHFWPALTRPLPPEIAPPSPPPRRWRWPGRRPPVPSLREESEKIADRTPPQSIDEEAENEIGSDPGDVSPAR